jgi:hypothetical protein
MAPVTTTARQLFRVCKNCGETYGVHGALPPHDRGEQCTEFVEVRTAQGERGGSR